MPLARHASRRASRAGSALAVALAVLPGLVVAAAHATPAAAQQPQRRPDVRASLPRHPEITGVVTCEAKVKYGVLSWTGAPDDPATSNNERDESRTTAQVVVAFSVDGGRTFRELPLDPKHRLDRSNRFGFLGSFPLPVPYPRTVMLRARAATGWADGSGLGVAKDFGPFLVPRCVVGAATAVPPAPPGFPVAATAARPAPAFDPGIVLAAAATLVVLLAVGAWARARVARP
jgi:hypothetical protein